MSYTADSIRDSIGIRIVTPDSIRIRTERKRPIRMSLKNTVPVSFPLEQLGLIWSSQMGQTRLVMFQNTNDVTQRRIHQRGGETTIVVGEKYCTTVTARSDFLTQNA